MTEIWYAIGQSNEVLSSPQAEQVPVSTTTGATTTFHGIDTTDIMIQDFIRYSGGDLLPASSSSHEVIAKTASTVTIDATTTSGTNPAVISNQSGYIRSEYGLPNSGSFWSRLAENYTRETGILVQVVEYGVGGTSFITDWAGLSGTGDAATVQNEGDGGFDPSNYLSQLVADANFRTSTINAITPYDTVKVFFQHGQADADPGNDTTTMASSGASTFAVQAGYYSLALQSMYNYLLSNLNIAPSSVYIGSSIPSASWGNNDAMDQVIEAGIDDALLTLTSATRGPMMHTAFASNWSVTTYPHNDIEGDDHTTIEGQEYMASVYSSFLIPAAASPTLGTPYSTIRDIAFVSINVSTKGTIN